MWQLNLTDHLMLTVDAFYVSVCVDSSYMIHSTINNRTERKTNTHMYVCMYIYSFLDIYSDYCDYYDETKETL